MACATTPAGRPNTRSGSETGVVWWPVAMAVPTGALRMVTVRCRTGSVTVTSTWLPPARVGRLVALHPLGTVTVYGVPAVALRGMVRTALPVAPDWSTTSGCATGTVTTGAGLWVR